MIANDGSSMTENSSSESSATTAPSKAGPTSFSSSIVDTRPLRTPEEWRLLASELQKEEEFHLPKFPALMGRQWLWSKDTFGPGKRTASILAHLRKELDEIEKKPDDLEEWVDAIFISLDGFWRHGGDIGLLLRIMWRKQLKNFARVWPDWRTLDDNEAPHHLD